MKNKFWIRKAAKAIIIIPIALFVFGMIVMSLWNYALPAAIHVSPISFWQALGILLLSKILFGGFGGGGWGGRRHHWKNEMQRKLATMTPEEKEKFKQDWKNRCSTWERPFPGESRFTKPSEPSQSATD